LLAISTMLFGDEELKTEDSSPHEFPHPFQTCIVLGLMLTEWWESADGTQRFLSEADAKELCREKTSRKVGKMSKQLRNYRSPQEIFDGYGADALRWYFFANQAPWNSIIYSEKAIKESIPEFLLRLWNVYSFFVIYANIDGFDPAARLDGDAGQLNAADLAEADGFRPASQRSELDRWVLSELHRTIAIVTERMDAYDNFLACRQLNAFVDALSNWYVRRSRDRFWASEKASVDKLDAYWTLYECLLNTCKLIAPFTPFLADTIWRNLAGVFGNRTLESVHLCDYPQCDSAAVDDVLSGQMALLREIASSGLRVRMENRLKVRQPLSKVEVILVEDTHRDWLKQHDALLREELNVKAVAYTQDADQYITYQVQPNFKRLGPRVGRLMPKVKQALTAADGSQLLAELNRHDCVKLQVEGESLELDSEDIQVRLQAKPGWAAAQGEQCVVVLSTELTPELIREGLARDLVRLVNERRKELECEFTDRIRLGIVTESGDIQTAVQENKDYIHAETLAVEVLLDPLADIEPVQQEIAKCPVALYVEVVGEA
jgi:isoleucyl-tRNA synthetase